MLRTIMSVLVWSAFLVLLAGAALILAVVSGLLIALFVVLHLARDVSNLTIDLLLTLTTKRDGKW